MALSPQAQKFSFETVTARGKWRWLTVADLTGTSPSYRIESIQSPYGRLKDDIPLDGTVILAMADSIEEISLAFAPSILLGPPASLSFTVDEGFGVSAPLTFLVTNNGSYSSLLGPTATPGAPYVTVTPTTTEGLSQNETATLSVAVDSTTLVSGLSPYATTVSVGDSRATNTPQSIPVTVVVRPKATITVLPLTLNFSVVKPLTGPFPAIADQTFDVSNTGPLGSVLSYLIQKRIGLSPWLTGITPTTGSITSGGSQTITVSVSPDDSTLTGTYTETLRISGYSTNTFVDVTINLVVTLCLPTTTFLVSFSVLVGIPLRFVLWTWLS